MMKSLIVVVLVVVVVIEHVMSSTPFPFLKSPLNLDPFHSFLRNFYASLQHHVDQYLVQVRGMRLIVGVYKMNTANPTIKSSI